MEREREREREGDGEGERERGMERETERERGGGGGRGREIEIEIERGDGAERVRNRKPWHTSFWKHGVGERGRGNGRERVGWCIERGREKAMAYLIVETWGGREKVVVPLFGESWSGKETRGTESKWWYPAWREYIV